MEGRVGWKDGCFGLNLEDSDRQRCMAREGERNHFCSLKEARFIETKKQVNLESNISRSITLIHTKMAAVKLDLLEAIVD